MSPHHASVIHRASALAAALALVACSPDSFQSPLAPALPALSGGGSGGSGGSGAAARSAANRVALPFHGTLEASHSSRLDPETNTGHIHVEGTGTATHLGRFTLVTDVTFTGTEGAERMTLTAANGDIIFATGTGQVVPSEDGLTLDTVEDMTITGGTGRFAGATGSFVLRQLDVAPTHSSSASFNGTISFGR
jgi:hypothetical protein